MAAIVAVIAVAVGVAGFFLAGSSHELPQTGPPPATYVPIKLTPQAAPSSASDFPEDLLGSDGVYREALVLQAGADETRTWEMLGQAALTKADVTLEIAIPNYPGQITRQAGEVEVRVPPFSLDPALAAANKRGGIGFEIRFPASQLKDGCPYLTFFRLSGTYAVTKKAGQGKGRTDVFALTTIRGESPAFPPGREDFQRCQKTPVRLATARQVRSTARHLDSADYATVKAQWISSPRVWWAIRVENLGLHQPVIADPLMEACYPWTL